MPLEQIRPTYQVYQPGRQVRDARHIDEGSFSFDYDGDEEVEMDEMDQPLKLSRPQDMNLLKLGGVGGVTRSGSWGQNLSKREIIRDNYISSLTPSATPISDALTDDKVEVENSDSIGSSVRARSTSPGQSQQRLPNLEHSRSLSSDTSVQGKASVESYSAAAAFSLRSFTSQRTSFSSTSSSGGAFSSQSPYTASRSPTAASETDSLETKMSRRLSQVVSASTSSGSTTGTAQRVNYFQAEATETSPQLVSPSSSENNHQVGPGVNRVQSIGRGSREKSLDDQAQIISPPVYLSPPSGEASLPLIEPSESSDSAKHLGTTLTLSAAAATPDLSSTFHSTSFAPPAPRRHTGAYALRSQSAMSQSGGALGTFWAGSGGRAAARELAQNSKSYDNAPFSQLEARRAKITNSPSQRDIGSTSIYSLKGKEQKLSASHSDILNRKKALRLSEGMTISRHAPLDTLATNAPLSTSLSGPDLISLGIESDGTATQRPSLPRTHTITNVLRTPTTEEWSRFLAKQGVVSATVATSNKMGRSSVTSARNSLSQRRNRRAAIKSSSSSSMDFDVIAATLHEQHSDALRLPESAMPIVGDSDEEENEAEQGDITENAGRPLNQLNLSTLNDDEDEEEDYDEEEEEEDQDSEGEVGSSSYERMQALHEAISRPPSRRGSPPPLLDLDHLAAFEAIMKPVEEQKRIRRLTREVSQPVMGYPPLSLGERRGIENFVILSDIGRGAYGLVKRVQLKDEETGRGYGPEFCIKYIIKSRILADCWRRHKVLGPIPIEIHVMDQLRRLHYKAPSTPLPWSVESLLGLQENQMNLTSLNEDAGHPALCKMVDFFEDHEFYYMVMPCFGQGQDLFDYIESQPHGLSSLQVRCTFGQVADGLQFLHQNGIVHRDVKDENVILDGNGHAQIIDFGSAAHINKNGRLFDTFSGTLDYAAAEILKGEKYAGKEQDVWALGVVGYVLLCGDCPFWNGQEAIEGLQFHTRAYQRLLERCNAIVPSVQLCTEEEGFQDEVEKRESDRRGQLDGGGKIEDAADLIQRCLELEVSNRPSMELVCQHRFLIGNRGWHGRRGWAESAATTTS